MIEIHRLNEAQASAARTELNALLQDAVSSGASLGFLPPLSYEEAERYWRNVMPLVADGSRVLVAAQRNGHIVGTVQLDLCMRANGLNRAEVMKLMVHTSVRRQGLGQALMMMIQGEARKLNRTTLVLDTRKGDPSEHLYQSLGWIKAGEIPRYARNADGELHTTVFYYKLLL